MQAREPGAGAGAPAAPVPAATVAALRALLLGRARRGELCTYRELAQELGLRPPHSIHQLTLALETLMAADIAARRPLLAALCISKSLRDRPRRGFFLRAQELGFFDGAPDTPEARVFHALEVDRVWAFYRASNANADRASAVAISAGSAPAAPAPEE